MAEHMPPHTRGRLGGGGRAYGWPPRTRVAKAGADFAICPDNTYHQAFKYHAPAAPPSRGSTSPEAVAEEARRQGYTRLGIFGTKYLAEGPVYPEALGAVGIET